MFCNVVVIMTTTNDVSDCNLSWTHCEQRKPRLQQLGVVDLTWRCLVMWLTSCNEVAISQYLPQCDDTACVREIYWCGPTSLLEQNLYVLGIFAEWWVEPWHGPAAPWKDPLANQVPKYHKSHPVWLAVPCKWLLLTLLCLLHILENKNVFSGIKPRFRVAQRANAKRLNVAINKRRCKAAMSSRPLPLSKRAQTSERWIIRPTLSSWACWFCKFCPFEQGTRGQTQLTHQAGQPPLCGKSPQAARSGSSKKNPCCSLRHQEATPLCWNQSGCSSSFLHNLLSKNWLLKSKIQSQCVLVGKKKKASCIFWNSNFQLQSQSCLTSSTQ